MTFTFKKKDANRARIPADLYLNSWIRKDFYEIKVGEFVRLFPNDFKIIEIDGENDALVFESEEVLTKALKKINKNGLN